MQDRVREAWGVSETYERYVGRWSRSVAREFLAWLAVPPEQRWADVGCGTGALTDGILTAYAPQAVCAIDRAKGFVAAARRGIPDARARFAVADAAALPWPSTAYGATVSGLVLNFVPDAGAMLREMARVTRPGGQVAVYVWDYRGGMELMSHFWDAAVEVTPADAAIAEAARFTICNPEPLEAAFRAAGLGSVGVRPIVIPTVFRDFDDYWMPFLGKQGPAPTYLAARDDATRERIRDTLQARLVSPDGSIRLSARAWAARGTV